MRRLLFLSLVGVTLLLSGCLSLQKKEYNYRLPASSMDRQCVTQCVVGRNNCQKICRLKNPGCFSRSNYNAAQLFKAYKQERISRGEKIKKTLREFEKANPCYNACTCTISYNT